MGTDEGLVVAVYRLVGNMFSHLAWAGYVDYYVGLAMLRAARAWTP